jgi:DNA repair exonuclease SbcCD ATPase subunit
MSLLDEHWAGVAKESFPRLADPDSPFSIFEVLGGSPNLLANLSRPDAIVVAMKLASTLATLRESLDSTVAPLLELAELGEEADEDLNRQVEGIEGTQEQFDRFVSRLEELAGQRAEHRQRYDELASLKEQVEAAEAELEDFRSMAEQEQDWVARRSELEAQVDALKARGIRETEPAAKLIDEVRSESQRLIRLSAEALERLDNDTASALREADRLDERLDRARAEWAAIEERNPGVLAKVEALRLYEQANREVANGVGGDTRETVESLMEQAGKLLKTADESLRAALKAKEALAPARLPFAGRKAGD